MAKSLAPVPTPIMSADYTYNAAGLLIGVIYGNFTSTEYTYDAAQRVTGIHHRSLAGSVVTLLKLVYTYTVNNLVESITEFEGTTTMAVTTFGYDARGRLTSEVRLGGSPYNLAYLYDQGGNRIMKTRDFGFGVLDETYYTYDIADPGLYLSKGNRLMKSRKEHTAPPFQQMTSSSSDTLSTSSTDSTLAGDGTSTQGFGGFPGGGGPVLVEEKWYYYQDENGTDDGNVTRVVTRAVAPFGTDQYSATRLTYALNGRTVTYVSGETWDYYDSNTGTNDNQTAPKNYTVTYANGFRYDGARQRYLNRTLDPAQLMLGTLTDAPGTVPVWSDYDGDSIYADFTMEAGVPTNQKGFEPGVGRFAFDNGAPGNPADPATVGHYHTNMIGTTRGISDSAAILGNKTVYTAFGERINGPSDRYGYAGAWGYQTDDTGSLPFVHVGARYYDPEIGRFLQRDPIGLAGGRNVYVYVRNNPSFYIDPSGLGPKWDWIKDKAGKAWEVIKKLPGYVLPSSPIPADLAPDIACAFMNDARRRHVVKDHDDGLEDKKCPTCIKLTPKPRKPPTKPKPPKNK